jgi:hypothetical protein
MGNLPRTTALPTTTHPCFFGGRHTGLDSPCSGWSALWLLIREVPRYWASWCGLAATGDLSLDVLAGEAATALRALIAPTKGQEE